MKLCKFIDFCVIIIIIIIINIITVLFISSQTILELADYL